VSERERERENEKGSEKVTEREREFVTFPRLIQPKSFSSESFETDSKLGDRNSKIVF